MSKLQLKLRTVVRAEICRLKFKLRPVGELGHLGLCWDLCDPVVLSQPQPSTTAMSSTPDQNYQRRLALKAVTGLPLEDTLYAIFNEFATLHQQRHRFIVYPQMNLKWKPQDVHDRRSEVPDFGLGNFTLPGSLPNFKLRCGVEAKRAINIMASLPPANSIMLSHDVASLFHSLSFQAQNQAKAAYKNGYPLSNDGIQWILLVGPYWMPKTFGPFSEAESSVRAHKITDSSDFEATMNLLDEMEGPPPDLEELFLLGTQESFDRLEEIIASTDHLAQPSSKL